MGCLTVNRGIQEIEDSQNVLNSFHIEPPLGHMYALLEFSRSLSGKITDQLKYSAARANQLTSIIMLFPLHGRIFGPPPGFRIGKPGLFKLTGTYRTRNSKKPRVEFWNHEETKGHPSNITSH